MTERVPTWRASARRVLLLAALLALPVCGPSPSFIQGDVAEQAGDWHTAVASFRQALAEDPDDEEIQARLANAEEHLVVWTLREIEVDLGYHDYTAALATVAPALELLPGEPRLIAGLGSIRSDGLVYLDQRLTFGDYRIGYEGAAVLQQSFPRDADVAILYDEAQTGFSNDLQNRAMAAEAEGRLGAALAHWLSLHDLSGSAEARSRSQAIVVGLRDEVRFTYTTRYDGFTAMPAVPVLSGALAAPAYPEEAMFSVFSRVDPPEFRHTWTSAIEYQPYLAGYREVNNPQYEYALDRVQDAEHDVLYAEGEVLAAEEELHRAEVARDSRVGQSDYDTYYGRWEACSRDLQSARADLLRQRADLQYARDRLRETAPTITEEVWDDYPYEVRTHTLQGQADYALDIVRAGQPPSEVYDVVVAESSDRSHDAHPHVGIAADPLSFPRDEAALAGDMEAVVASVVSDWVVREFATYRDGFRDRGMAMAYTDPRAATEQLIRYVLLNPTDVPAEVAEWLDAHVDLWNVSLLGAI